MKNPLEELKKKLDIKQVKQCPKCNSLSLVFENNKLICKKCGFEQGVMK